tara:strand:+ start:595 stop:831 length:237 start_codon:yes stop_codon:yes gene_type:complete
VQYSLNPNPRRHDRDRGSTQSMLHPAGDLLRSVIVDKAGGEHHGGNGSSFTLKQLIISCSVIVSFTICCFLIMLLGML